MLNPGQEAEMRRAIWAQVCVDYYQPALDFARRRLGNSDDAFVVVQDSTVRLLRLIPNPDRIADRRNYWIKTVQNQCNDLLRQRIRAAARTVSLDTPVSDDDDNESPPLDPPDRSRGPQMDAEINEKTENLLRELESHCDGLTKREKDLLALHLRGLSNDQIASAWRDDVKIIRVDMNAVLVKIRYRLKHGQGIQIGAS
jgi:RNA polymerase sigma factor (sigma-70 family)